MAEFKRSDEGEVKALTTDDSRAACSKAVARSKRIIMMKQVKFMTIGAVW